MTITVDLLDDIFVGDKVYKVYNSIQMINLQRGSGRLSVYQTSGVYILLGPQCNRRQLYIGQTSNIAKRIKQHEKAKEFWTESVFFLFNKELTKTETEWLEEALIKIVISNNLFDVITNYQIPNNVIINDSDRLRVNQMLDQIIYMLDVFGCHLYNQNTIDRHLSSKSIIDRIAKSYKYLPDDNYGNEMDEEVEEQYYKDILYYDLGSIIYIPKESKLNLDNDKYFNTEKELKQYIDENGKDTIKGRD